MEWTKWGRKDAGGDRKRREETKVQRVEAPFPHKSLLYTCMHARTPFPCSCHARTAPFPPPWPACLICAPNMPYRNFNSRRSQRVKLSWADIARPATPLIGCVNYVAAHQGQDARGFCRCKAAGRQQHSGRPGSFFPILAASSSYGQFLPMTQSPRAPPALQVSPKVIQSHDCLFKHVLVHVCL
jgi:hypothetical protein